MLVGEFLDNLIEHVRECELVAIAGDLNASATDQGSSETEKRRPNLLEVFSYLNLVGGNSRRVDEEFTNSDHQAIV